MKESYRQNEVTYYAPPSKDGVNVKKMALSSLKLQDSKAKPRRRELYLLSLVPV
jgi:hypothetical protein